MHEAAIAGLARHIGGVLRNTSIEDGWPVFDSISPRLNALGTEIKKHKDKAPYLNTSDVFSIFYDTVPAAIRNEHKDKTPNGPLPDVLSQESFAAVESELLSYIQSVPRDYKLLLPLPTTTLPLTTVEFASGIGLQIDQSEGPERPKLGLMAAFTQGWNAEVRPGVPYLYREVRGYVRNSLESQTTREALSALKVMLQQGIFRGLLTIDRKPVAPALSLMGPTTHFSVEKSRLVCIDRNPTPRGNFYVDLPLDVSRLIERIEFSSTNKALSAAAEKNALGVILGELFRLPATLAASSSPDSTRVRAASEWCFDSYASDSETLAFLQICIGLEALLGEDTEGEALTKTLADRCAYLLGTSVKGRTSIRDSFRSLYKARSKIVHGNALSLAESERVYMDWGRTVLEYAIAKELKFLGLEKA